MISAIKQQSINANTKKKPKLIGKIDLNNSLNGAIHTENKIVSLEETFNLKGKINIMVKVIEKGGSFLPYVDNEILYFKSQASVKESGLIISGK